MPATEGINRDIRPYLRDIGRFPLLGPEEKLRITARCFEGDFEARNELAQANLRLVIRIVFDLLGESREDVEDLIMEGNLGLLRAIESFDPSRGVQFQTYAAHWIRRSVRDAIVTRSSGIRVPREKSREPAVVHGLVGSEGYEFDIEDDSAWDVLDRVVHSEDVKAVLGRMHKLTEREARVIKMRFGMAPFSEPMSLSRVGDVLGLYKGTVLQIQNKALAKLSHDGGR